MNKWSVVINDAAYEISYDQSIKEGHQHLYVNGIEHILPSMSFFHPNQDYCFYIDDHQLNLVTFDRHCDLAIDGVYQTSGKQYKKCKMRLWGWIYIGVYILLFIAMIVIPKVLYNFISMWIFPVAPAVVFAIFLVYRSSKNIFLPTKKLLIKPTVEVVMMLLILGFIMYQAGKG